MVKVILDHIDLGHMLVGSYAHVTQQFILRLAEHFYNYPAASGMLIKATGPLIHSSESRYLSPFGNIGTTKTQKF